MKYLWIVTVFLGALLTGCTPVPTGGNQTREGDKKGTEDTRTTVEKLKDAIKAEAAIFHKEAKEHLAGLDKQYEGWKAKAAEAKGEAKVKMEAQLAALDKQKAKVKEQLTKLEGTGHELWKETKKETQKAIDELKEAYEKAKDHFK
jgi:hypothetical protein